MWRQLSLPQAKRKRIILIAIIAVLAFTGEQYFAEKEKERLTGIERERVVESTRKAAGDPIQRSRREILAGLPEKPPIYGTLGASEEQEEATDVFRELGAVDGEAAMDYLMELYGKSD